MQSNIKRIVKKMTKMFLNNLKKEVANNENGKWTSDLYEKAVNEYCKESIKYLYENGCPIPKTSSVVNKAVQYGYIKLLKLLHSYNFPWDESSTLTAAKYGNLECLKYLCDNGCQKSTELCSTALTYDNANIFRWTYQNDCFMEGDIVKNAITSCSVKCLAYIVKDKLTPITSEHIEMAKEKNAKYILPYLEKHQSQDDETNWTIEEYFNAMYDDNEERFKYLYEKRCGLMSKPTTTEYELTDEESLLFVSSTLAAKSLKYLKLAHKLGIPWNSSATTSAAMSGNLGCLKYAHKNGCDMDIGNLYANAFSNNNLHIVNWLYNNGYAIPEGIEMTAIHDDNVECLQFIHKNRGNLHDGLLEAARKANCTKCVEFLENKH